MKRYDFKTVGIDHSIPYIEPIEDPYGEWVKYEDVIDIIELGLKDEIRKLRYEVKSLHQVIRISRSTAMRYLGKSEP